MSDSFPHKEDYEAMLQDVLADIKKLETELERLEVVRDWLQERIFSAVRQPFTEEALNKPPYLPGGPKRRRLPLEALRSYVMEKKEVTAPQVASHFHISSTQARAKLRELEKMGTVEAVKLDTGVTEYRFVKPDPNNAPRPRESGNGSRAASGPVAGTGRGTRFSTNKDYQAVVNEALASGWSLKGNRLVKEGHMPVVVHATPSDVRAAANLRASIRQSERGANG